MELMARAADILVSTLIHHGVDRVFLCTGGELSCRN